MREVQIAALILAAVAASKCTPAVLAQPLLGKPNLFVGHCRQDNVVVVFEDADGAETVTVTPYWSCPEGAAPKNPLALPFCHDAGNPYAPLLWGEARDRQNIVWMCQLIEGAL